MSFLVVILTIALAGLLVWALITYVPMPVEFRRAIFVVSTVALIIYIANVFGLLSELPVHLK